MDEDEAANAGGAARVKVSVQALSCNQLFDMHWTVAARFPDDAEMSVRRSDYQTAGATAAEGSSGVDDYAQSESSVSTRLAHELSAVAASCCVFGETMQLPNNPCHASHSMRRPAHARSHIAV